MTNEINIFSNQKTGDYQRTVHIASSVNASNVIINIETNCDKLESIKCTPNGMSQVTQTYTCEDNMLIFTAADLRESN